MNKTLTPKQKQDLDMISNPNKWPDNFIMPLKRQLKEGFPELGFLLNHPDCPLERVFMDSIFSLKDCYDRGESPMISIKHKTYPDLQTMLEDGWEVD